MKCVSEHFRRGQCVWIDRDVALGRVGEGIVLRVELRRNIKRVVVARTEPSMQDTDRVFGPRLKSVTVRSPACLSSKRLSRKEVKAKYLNSNPFICSYNVEHRTRVHPSEIVVID